GDESTHRDQLGAERSHLRRHRLRLPGQLPQQVRRGRAPADRRILSARVRRGFAGERGRKGVSDTSEIRSLLARLPRRKIDLLPAGTSVPHLKASGSLSDYNGFTGKERLRKFELAKWLMKQGAMKHSGRCSICGERADQQHAEDYFDLRTWMDICRGCHVSLHGRFR